MDTWSDLGADDFSGDADADISADIDADLSEDVGQDLNSDTGDDLGDTLDNSGSDTDSEFGGDLNVDSGDDLNTDVAGDFSDDIPLEDTGIDNVGENLNDNIDNEIAETDSDIFSGSEEEATSDSDLLDDAGVDLNEELGDSSGVENEVGVADNVGEDLNDEIAATGKNDDSPQELNDGDELNIDHNESIDSADIGQQEQSSDVASEETIDVLQILNDGDEVDHSGLESNNDSMDIAKVENIQEWLSDINPNYDPFDYTSPYDNNCGSCAFAVEQRLDGDTELVASAEDIGTPAEMNEMTGMEQTPMSPGEIQDYLISQGAGSHGIVGIDRAEGPGHWFNAYYDGEKVVAIDGQTGETQDWPPDYGDVTNWDISIRKEKN
jgi:hypothetical protein